VLNKGFLFPNDLILFIPVNLLKYALFLPFQAYKVQAQYLMADKEPARFQNWMKNTTNANSKQAGDCFKCLDEWNRNFND
jgi:Barrier to autointegration factor